MDKNILGIDYISKFMFRNEEFDTVRKCFYSTVNPSMKREIKNMKTSELIMHRLDMKYLKCLMKHLMKTK